MLQEEGLENAWKRHAVQHRELRAGLEKLGFAYIGREGARLPQLNAVMVPSSVDEVRLRQVLLNDYSIEIGTGLGALAGKILRIGLMGQARNRRNITLCLSAIAAALPQVQAIAPKTVRV